MIGLKAGIYKHYKGALYLVLGAARHSDTDEKFVAYVPLGVNKGPRIAVRPYDAFFENIEVNGKSVSRFSYIGEGVDDKLAKQYDHLSGYIGEDRIDD